MCKYTKRMSLEINKFILQKANHTFPEQTRLHIPWCSRFLYTDLQIQVMAATHKNAPSNDYV